MALELINTLEIPKNTTGIRKEIAAGFDGDDGVAIALNNTDHSAVHVQKPTEAAEVFFTTTTHKKNGLPLTDLNDADIMWRSKSTGVTELFDGDAKGLTGVKIVPDTTPTTNAIQYSISNVD